VRQDVIHIFEELEEAKNNLSHIQAIMKEREKTSVGWYTLSYHLYLEVYTA